MLFTPKCRPPTCLYSTRSGPRAACAHSAAHWRTSARRSPICLADGPRIGTLNGSQSCPAANRVRSAPESHFFLAAARTSAGQVHSPVRLRTPATSAAGDGDKVGERGRTRGGRGTGFGGGAGAPEVRGERACGGREEVLSAAARFAPAANCR